MIENIVHVHDKFQFELKLEYQFDSGNKSKEYDIDTYLFFPNSLGISPGTFKKQDFYHDVQSYIRLKTPTVLLRDIVPGKDSPLRRVQTEIEQFLSQNDRVQKADFEYQVKMFCCICKSSVRDHVHFIKQKVHSEDAIDGIMGFLSCHSEIVQSFRGLRSQLNVPTVGDDMFSIFLFADEYLSLLFEAYSFELLEFLDVSELKNNKYLRKSLIDLISAELDYRKGADYPSIPEIDSTNEAYVYRISVLKKYMGTILFLNTRMKRDGGALEQLAFALAAGVAMVFAVFTSLWAQSRFAHFSVPFVLALVVSYIFKDRIKEMIRTYLGNRLRHFLFDHKMNIYANPKVRLGWCKESMTHISEDKVPPEVLKLRNRAHITEIENGEFGEHILIYRKRIRLFRKHFDKTNQNQQLESINDIVRMNVKRFLRKMDNPKRPIYVMTGEHYKRVLGRRVYHINMIIKYSFDQKAFYKRFRIVLNRGGIKRIEEGPSNEV